MKKIIILLFLSIFIINGYSQQNQKIKFSELPTQVKLEKIENAVTVFEAIIVSIMITSAFSTGGFTIPIIGSVIIVTTEITFLIIERRIKKRAFK